MLHLTLAANLLNAIGGRPRFDSPDAARLPTNAPTRPALVRDVTGPVRTGSNRTDADASSVAAAPGAPPEGDCYETIGQFYDAIRRGVHNLCASSARRRRSAATRPPADLRVLVRRQWTRDRDPRPGHGSRAHEIIEQGEGAAHHDVCDGDRDMFHPDRGEVGHYDRIEQLKLGRRYRPGDTPISGPTGERIPIRWDGVLPMRRNPRTADHPEGSRIRVAQDAFNDTYSELLGVLDAAFDGSPRLLGKAVNVMFGLKGQALRLMKMPVEDGVETAGPTFEHRTRPQS